jgi:hypothetical protein
MDMTPADTKAIAAMEAIISASRALAQTPEEIADVQRLIALKEGYEKLAELTAIQSE